MFLPGSRPRSDTAVVVTHLRYRGRRWPDCSPLIVAAESLPSARSYDASMAVNEVRQLDLAVVGGGAIGLCVARLAARRGRRVCVIDPSPGRGAIWAAAGMLAPASEAHFGDEALIPLLVEASRRWGDFASELVEDVGYRTTGTILIGHDAGDRAELERVVQLQRALGLEVEALDRAELHALEPGLDPSHRFGVLVPGDHQVDTRLLVDALLRELDALGVVFVRERATAVHRGPVPALALADGQLVRAAQLVLCPGAELTLLGGLEGQSLPAIRPVKGHVLRLAGEQLLERIIRATVRGRSIYLVPRVGGELVVGASVEERGFDLRVQAGEVHRLLNDARRELPGIDELELRALSTGLRPGSPDNAPSIELLDGGQVVLACGHHRNGVLLAPLTAELVLALLDGIDHPGLELVAQSHRRADR